MISAISLIPLAISLKKIDGNSNYLSIRLTAPGSRIDMIDTT